MVNCRTPPLKELYTCIVLRTEVRAQFNCVLILPLQT